MDGPPSVMAPPEQTDSGFAGLPEALERALAGENLFRAESLEELAKFMELDARTLQHTVEQYNAFCRRGEDAHFAKPRRCLFALDKPP